MQTFRYRSNLQLQSNKEEIQCILCTQSCMQNLPWQSSPPTLSPVCQVLSPLTNGLSMSILAEAGHKTIQDSSAGMVVYQDVQTGSFAMCKQFNFEPNFNLHYTVCLHLLR